MQTPHRLGEQAQKVLRPHLRYLRLSCCHSAWLLRSPKCSLPFPFKHLSQAAILDSHTPNQYGPRGFWGRNCRDLARTGAGVESMADDAREKGDRQQPPADQAALSARLKRLGERLGHIHADHSSEGSPQQPPSADPSAMARGFRLSTELVAGVVVGAALGWVLDRLLGIAPWGMIVFLLLGFVAGVLNVMRAAGVVPSSPLDPKR
jgi:ATP synthase protein I